MNLLLKKLLVAFVIGFVPVFLMGIVNILESIAAGNGEFDVFAAALAGLVSGAAAAGLRLLLAEFTNFLPTDRLHGPKASEHVAATRDGNGDIVVESY
jgi:hypothetical protein